MSFLDMNMNMNMKMAFAGPDSGGRVLRARFNSDVESRLVDVTNADLLVPPVGNFPGNKNYPSFHPDWDADLRAYLYLDDFLATLTSSTIATASANAAAVAGATAADVDAAVATAAMDSISPGNSNWRVAYAAAATAASTPPDKMTRADLGTEVRQMLELGLEREARFAEIIDQDDADGAINYWLGMLKIDPARHPGTYLMVRVGRRIGEHISMCLKGDFKCPRPSQLCPAITPMIDPPVTPSYPAGHAVQAYLISYLLAYSLATQVGGQMNTSLPQHVLPTLQGLTGGARADGPLFHLAGRVAENRIVAGIHYPTDIKAGEAVAVRAFLDLTNVASVWNAGGLRDRVRDEFPQYRA